MGTACSNIKTLPKALSLAIYSDEIVLMLDAVQGCTDPQALDSLLKEIKTQQEKCVEKLRNIVQCIMDWLKTWLIGRAEWRAKVDEKELEMREVIKRAETLLEQCKKPWYVINGSLLDKIELSILESIVYSDHEQMSPADRRHHDSYIRTYGRGTPMTRVIERAQNIVETSRKKIITFLRDMIIGPPEQEGVPKQTSVTLSTMFKNAIGVSSSVKEKVTDQAISNRLDSALQDIEDKFSELSTALLKKTDFTEMLKLLEKVTIGWIMRRAEFLPQQVDKDLSDNWWDWARIAGYEIERIENSHTKEIDALKAKAAAKTPAKA